jgi:hypothetical protein
MDRTSTTSARSFEQDLLWSVLDQDAVPDILGMARTNWNVGGPAAWAELRRQAALGRLRANRGVEPSTPVDLAQLPPEQGMEDQELFVEPTEATFTRLNELAGAAATA